MRYLSTRNAGPGSAAYSFEDVLLAGLAEDGGLFVPETLPALEQAALRGLAGLPYAEVAARVVGLFAGEAFEAADLRRLTEAAYGAFRHAAVAPLVQLDERLWLLELFHGPTLAFKDLALQLVGRLFDTVLARRHEHVTIIGATSGDTGSAALAACRDRAALDIFMLYPHGRISEVQRRQMTTVDAANTHAVAIEGTFDDCQDIVKALFADRALRQELNLSAVNSINFARVAAQIVYYISAGLALGAASGRAISFSVPTGNFGNVYAGHLARAMGLPIERLVIGTNANDVLARYLTSGTMSLAPVVPSLSPSMDIQVASNFERLLFELKGRNGTAVANDLTVFRETGVLAADDQGWRRASQLFAAHRVDDAATLATIADTYRCSGVLIDPHTAVGVAAARANMSEETDTPMIALATAHPAKFPEAVARASGIQPPVPEPLADIMERRERVTMLPNDFAAVRGFLRRHARRPRPNRGAA
ncbi:MAG: threonine synthase [Alphaproteobacteria bacterium]|nr:threonine synthase [Alphaproteobacteria bacterium]